MSPQLRVFHFDVILNLKESEMEERPFSGGMAK